MDALFHFATPNTRPYKQKNFSAIPSKFVAKEAISFENHDKNDIEEPQSPMIFQKKSQFSTKLPENFVFTPLQCDDEETTVNVDDSPISPLSIN